MNLRKRAVMHLGAAAVVCALVAACSPPVRQTPTPSPTPTSASPSETQLEREARLAFEAAERSYRTFRREYTRITLVGGADSPTKIMSQTASGPYLKTMTGFLAARKREGWRSSEGVKIGYVRPASYTPDEVKLQVCEDGTRSKLLDKEGRTVRTGTVQKLVLNVRPIAGTWKIWDGQERAAKSCAG